jgi:hypothetical protein
MTKIKSLVMRLGDFSVLSLRKQAWYNYLCMFKKHLAFFGSLVFMLGITLTHGGFAFAHSNNHHETSSHQNSSSCQTICQTPLSKQKNKLAENKDEDDVPETYPQALEGLTSSFLTSNLLKENELWKQSSWTPPDIVLLSGSYSTTL